uniref:SUEL-type lectin domain-containing protein n=1 Tax=Maylandia zebra TaxID=106582 RepID=A0A3P9DPE7_9CICH
KIFIFTCIMLITAMLFVNKNIYITSFNHFMNSSSGEGQVIVVSWANYGRRDNTTCPDGNPDHVKNVLCSSPNSTEYVTNRYRSSNTGFGDPCSGTYKYLEVFYTCQGKNLKPLDCIHSCAHKKVIAIVVYWADYGRRDTTTCSQHRPTHEIQNAHCPNPTTKVADSCNGKSSCIIEASNSVFGDPCPGTYKYLEVAYDCERKYLRSSQNKSCTNCSN